MPKRNRPKQAPEAYGSIPTESPVPGVNIELATLLVQAVKAQRKSLSKSSSLLEEADDAEKEALRQGMIQDFRNAANDKASFFLNALRNQIEYSSVSASKSSSRRTLTNTSSSAPTHCLKFLLDILSDESNSIHLRRSSLALSRNILEKSSDSRSFLASGRCLLDFISVIEGVEHDEIEEDEHGRTSTINNTSPKSIFQLEAMELIHYLASKFGRFYTQFTVASRLLGDASANFTMQNTLPTYNVNDLQDGERNHPKRVSMKILRRERDIALQCGPKACHSLGRIVERADGYFRILVPRFGGFNSANKGNTNCPMGETDTNSLDPSIIKIGVHHDGDDDDDSVDWEEGYIHSSDSDDFDESTHSTPSDFHDDKSNDHQAAVEQTLNIMEKGGVLLDGNLDVQVGVKSIQAEPTPMRAKIEASIDSPTSSQPADAHAETRRKLQNIVKKFSTRRLPCLNRWIHALSHADGMEERAVIDPAAAAANGKDGPVSLVLLSEDNRVLRSQLLLKLIKTRGDVQGVLRSAATLGIGPKGIEYEKDNSSSSCKALGHESKGTASTNGSRHENHDMAGMKRPWMPGVTESLAAAVKKRKPKISRIKVVYRKR